MLIVSCPQIQHLEDNKKGNKTTAIKLVIFFLWQKGNTGITMLNSLDSSRDILSLVSHSGLIGLAVGNFQTHLSCKILIYLVYL